MSYELDFLPVGENTKSGDAILFRFWDDTKGETEADQKICLIDGGYAETGESIKKHIEKYYNTSTIDLVISTHPDLDHIGGLSYILENFTVKKLWLHRPWQENLVDGLSDCFKDGRVTDNSVKNKLQEGLNKAYELEQLAIDKNITVEDPFTGVTAFNGVITVLSPTEEYYRQLLTEFRCTPDPIVQTNESYIAKMQKTLKKIFETWITDKLEDEPITTAENNSSAVILLKISSSRYILLTSDAGVPPLLKVAEKLSEMGIKDKIVYYQIPHHGSKHNVNTNLLNNLIGDILDEGSTISKGACVSVAKNSDYKHPSQAVINAFVRRGIKPVITKGKNLCKHSDDIPIREGYTTAKQLEFCANYEIEG